MYGTGVPNKKKQPIPLHQSQYMKLYYYTFDIVITYDIEQRVNISVLCYKTIVFLSLSDSVQYGRVFFFFLFKPIVFSRFGSAEINIENVLPNYRLRV